MITENDVLKSLKKSYEQKGKADFRFISRMLARKLKVSTCSTRYPLLRLEKKGLIERTDYGRSTIVWKTCFDGKQDK